MNLFLVHRYVVYGQPRGVQYSCDLMGCNPMYLLLNPSVSLQSHWRRYCFFNIGGFTNKLSSDRLLCILFKSGKCIHQHMGCIMSDLIMAWHCRHTFLLSSCDWWFRNQEQKFDLLNCNTKSSKGTGRSILSHPLRNIISFYKSFCFFKIFHFINFLIIEGIVT